MQTLSPMYAKVLSMIDATMFDRAGEFPDHAGVSFAIKATYEFPQISTNLSYISACGLFFAVNNGTLLFEKAFTNEGGYFQMFNIKDEAFNKIERSF